MILLFLLIVYEIRLMMAARAKDMAGRLLCTGMATLIAFQSFANIAVATGIFPNTGLPLPFISFGKQFADQYFYWYGACAQCRTAAGTTTLLIPKEGSEYDNWLNCT